MSKANMESGRNLTRRALSYAYVTGFTDSRVREAIGNRSEKPDGQKESRYDRAFALANASISLERALSELPFFCEYHSPVQGKDRACSHESRVDFNPSDTIGLLGELTSKQLDEISTASKHMQENLSLLRPGTGMDGYLLAMLQYGLKVNASLSDPAGRETFVDTVSALRKVFPRLRVMLDEGINDRSSLVWEMRRDLAQLLRPWLGNVSDTLAEHSMLHDFDEKSASEHTRRPISGWHSKGAGEKFELADNLGMNRLADDTQQQISELLTQTFREVVSDSERDKLNPGFFNKDQATEFAAKWWERQKGTQSISEESLSKVIAGLLTAEATKKEGWTLQDIYNITEIIECSKGPNQRYLSGRMVGYQYAQLAEAIAIPLNEHVADASQPGRTEILEIVLSRLKNNPDGSIYGYERWFKKANGVK